MTDDDSLPRDALNLSRRLLKWPCIPSTGRGETPGRATRGVGSAFADTSGTLEERLVKEWIARNRPDGADYRVVALPASRRRRGKRRTVAGLQTALAAGDDALLVPLRVAWGFRRGRKRRIPSLLDLITLGDPRDPNRLLQELIVRFRPEQITVLAGETATLSALRRRWTEDRVQRSDAPTGFAEYVALQGALTLEVAERRLRGNRYKVSRFVGEDLVGSASFQAGLANLAQRSGEDESEVSAKASRYLKGDCGVSEYLRDRSRCRPGAFDLHDGIRAPHSLRPRRARSHRSARTEPLACVPSEPQVEHGSSGADLRPLRERSASQSHRWRHQHELLPDRWSAPQARDLLHPADLQGQRDV